MVITDLDRTARATCGHPSPPHDFPSRADRDTRHRHPGPAGPATRLVDCAVRGTMTVRSRAETDGHVRVVAGRRYYFCCADCAALFDAEPLAYVGSAA